MNVDHSTALRNDEDYKKRSIKNGAMQAAHYPPMVQFEMLTKFGVDFATQPVEALAIAIEHYPDCLTVPKESLKNWKKKRKTVSG